MTDRNDDRIVIVLPAPTAIFAEESPGYPYPGRPLREAAAERLLEEARLRRSAPSLAVEVRAASPPLAPDEEDRLRRDWAGFYRAEAERADLAVRVNRIEGWRSFLLGVAGSLLAAAIVVPIRLWIGPDFLLLEFLLVVVIWILMWDSLELLLFDSMFLRMKRAALVKLRDAEVRFRYSSAPGNGTGQI